MSDPTPAPLPPQNNLPAAVRRQVADANALIAELNAKPGQIPAGTEYQTMPGSETPGTMATGHNERWQPASTQQAPAAQPPAQPQYTLPQPPSAAVQQAPEDSQWEQRYRTLQGKYDAENRMMREIMATQQQTMDKLVEQRQSSLATPAPAPQQTPEEYLKSLGVTDKELEDYGEVLPIMVKMAQNMIKPTAAKLERELERTRQAAGTVAKAQVKSGQEHLFATMDQRVPQWKQINEDENFLAWLDRVDIIYGTSRRDILKTAFENLDTARVVAIFETFVQEDSVRRSTEGRPQIDPSTLIAPGVPRGGAAEAPGGANSGSKRILTEGEIRDFYTRVRKQQVSTEQYAAFSAEIASATAEGRVRPDRPNHHLN